ncbi:MAG: ATP-binding cassette domain-containing protein, partial [Bacteroidaceae bacterium]|nr:ATP-binding cassette domain-containing protein [Bacteroidaceae bacterium]
MDVRNGQVWVLTGRNGGGKTSLLRVMAGLLQPQAGVVERCEGLSVGVLPQTAEVDRS